MEQTAMDVELLPRVEGKLPALVVELIHSQH